MNVVSKKIVGHLAVIILILSFAATIQSFALAQENLYTDITAQQAYQMINRYQSSDILILDVRNDSEHKFAHLYDALQIPCYMLESLIDFYVAMPNATIIDWRSVKLMTHIDDPVIVYCAGGSRSSVACNILSEKGFSQVYNIVGGMNAWLQAGLPIYNTAHNVTVNNGKITIDPLTSFNCTCGTPRGSNDESVVQNQTLDIIDQTENFTQGSFSFEYNGTTYDNAVSASTIWNYRDSDYNSNITGTLELLQSAGSIDLQDYVLKYQIQNEAYNFSVTSILQPLDTDTYNASSTMVRFAPVGKTELLSIERVNFESPVTLSGLYSSLERVCKNLASTYRSDGRRHNNDILKGLADSYGHMADGLKSLSKLVHKELRNYDREIIQSIAVLTDDLCWLCTGACSILIGIITCGPLDWVLVPAVCIAIGVGTAGIGGVVCAIIAGVIIGYVCEYGIGLGCQAICENYNYCGLHYVDYEWFDTIGNGIIYTPEYIVGEPDYASAWIWGQVGTDGGTVVGHLSQVSSGGMNVHVYREGTSGFWIWVSYYNDNDWELVYYGYEEEYQYWTDIYAQRDDPYWYVAVQGYHIDIGCSIKVDSVTANL
jgi:rhodanese-related sulfurtransferase